MKQWLGWCLLLVAMPVAAIVDPFLDWRTLESEHFAIHYPVELDAEARRALGIAETVHERLSRELNWVPERRTQLVLTDQFDQANGFASPLPYNFIYLFLTPPDGLNSLGDYDNWLELLISHEYTHTLHLDRARGFPQGARRFLGRNPLLFPNLFNPTWLIEGLAVEKETDRERGVGRGQSALFDMMMRAELEGGFKPFDRVGMDGISEWPAGRTPYLYGAYFYQYLDDRHGEGSARRLVENYSNNIIPYLVNPNLRGTIGLDGKDLWRDFERWLNRRFQPQYDAIDARETVAGERLSHHGYQTGSPRALADGRVFYLRADASRQPALMVWTAEQGSREVAEVLSGARLDAHPEAGVILAMPEICRNRNQYYDLFHVDPDSGRRQRLTRCSRYRDAAWLPDGKGLVASRMGAGKTRVDLLDADGERQRGLWESDDGSVPGRLDVSPDGERVAMALWRPDRGWTLGLLDIASGDWQELLSDQALVGDPRFEPDGQAVLFSSEHGGVYNLRRLDLTSGEVRSLSHVRGGAFSPTRGRMDGPVFYLGYGPGGYDLWRLPAEQLLSAELPPAEKPPFSPPEHESATGRDRDYSPWSTLRPTSWFPLARASDAVTELGVSVSSVDALQTHQYSASLLYEPTEELASGAVGYSWANRFSIAFTRFYDYEEIERAEDEWELFRAREEDQAQAMLSLPLLRRDWGLVTHLGGSYTRERDRRVAADAWRRPERLSGAAGVALDFDNSGVYPKSFSPEDGRDIRLLAESNEAFGSDFSGRVYSLDWREYFPLGGQHVLALRAFQAWGTERPRPFRLGGVNVSDLDGMGGVFDQRRYALPGYKAVEEGRRIRILSADWRFPIARPERSFTRFPFGAQQFSGRLYTESGAVWNFGSSPGDARQNVGAELVADLNIFYRLNFRLRLGVARGRDEGGETQAYLFLGLPGGL